jgi:NAD(P)-dependent dehydrogenase (short-subunit alcohol dehydrogenase family)
VVLLRERVVLVSGGTQGVGAAVARAAAREGATVVVTGRRREPGAALAAELGCAYVSADASDVDSARASAQAVIDRYGRIDCLVNAAGLTSRGTLLDRTASTGSGRVARKYGAEPVADPTALLRSGVDGVVIAAATDAHPRRELAAFTEVVAGTRESPCTVADAVEAGWIAEACTVSRQEHRPVRVSEVRSAA